MENIQWEVKDFQSLTNYELYAILQLRNIVFVVEQQCVLLDMDDRDIKAFHIMAWHKGELIAYARLLPSGVAYPETSIGRVVVKENARGHQLGRELMNRSIDFCWKTFDSQTIKIGAQLYLQKFYESLSFKTLGDVYKEHDSIEHIKMILHK